MTQAANPTRQYSVHARSVDSHYARLLEEASFEAAAVAYIEDFHPVIDEDNEVSIIVRDIETGHEHCFRVDVASGEAAPCG